MKCSICKSKHQLVRLAINGNWICNNCIEAIIEISFFVHSEYLTDAIKKQKSKGIEVSKNERGKIIFQAYKSVVNNEDFIRESLDGEKYVYMADIRKIAADSLASSNYKESPQSIGGLIRNYLNLPVGKRHGSGIPVYVDYEKIQELDRFFE